MEIAIQFPGRQASDARNTVTLQEPGTPWPIKFHFLRVFDEEKPDEVQIVNVGFEIGRTYEVEPGSGRTELVDDPRPIDPVTLQRIVGNFSAYLQLAQTALVVKDEGIVGALKLLRGPGAKPARLTDDFYRLVGSDYEARRNAGEPHLVKALAAAHHVTPGAASRWVKEARKRGYIREEANSAS